MWWFTSSRTEPSPSLGHRTPRSPGIYSFAAFQQPFAENHFGVLFLCGNIRHDTPRNLSLLPPPAAGGPARRGLPAQAGGPASSVSLAFLAPFPALSPLFPIYSALFGAMGVAQLLCIQALPHSFYRHGGVCPLRGAKMNQETTKPSPSVDCPAVTYKVDRGVYPDSVGAITVTMSVGPDDRLWGIIPG